MNTCRYREEEREQEEKKENIKFHKNNPEAKWSQTSQQSQSSEPLNQYDRGSKGIAAVYNVP